MAHALFIWNPDLGATRQVTPAVHVNKFGDGYELRTRLGINTKPEQWNVTFTKSRAEINPLLEFIEQRGGYEAFDWETPLGQTKTFVCRQWSFNQMEKGLFQLTGTFEEVFES